MVGHESRQTPSAAGPDGSLTPKTEPAREAVIWKIVRERLQKVVVDREDLALIPVYDNDPVNAVFESFVAHRLTMLARNYSEEEIKIIEKDFEKQHPGFFEKYEHLLGQVVKQVDLQALRGQR
jgi:hypothetical protein